MASSARWASLLSYLFLVALAVLVSYWLQLVSRAPLPHEEVGLLADLAGVGATIPWPKPRIRVSILTRVQEQEGDFVQSLAAALGGDVGEVAAAEQPPPRLLGAKACQQEDLDVGSAAEAECLESLEEDEEEGARLGSSFDLVLVPSASCSSLLLGTGTSAVLRWQRGLPAKDLAALAARRLRETWLQPLSFENRTSLFEIAPAYGFSFFLVGDCQQRVAWDFLGVVFDSYLERFMSRLKLLFDLEVDSQVVQCGSLGGAGSVVNAAALQEDFLRRASEWPGDTVVRDAPWLHPLVRMVAFKPSAHVRVVDDTQQSQRSFAVQGWGTVAMVGAALSREAPCEAVLCGAGEGANNTAAGVLSHCEARQAASAWISALRSWLLLPPSGPLPREASSPEDPSPGRCGSKDSLAVRAASPALNGLADWELLLVAQAVHGVFLRRATETLENFLTLVESLPDVVVKPEVSDSVFEAAAEVRRAVAAAAEGEDLAGALAMARQALLLALRASHDNTVEAEMFFSAWFKSAVYMPLGLPVVVPVLVALYRSLARVARLRTAAKVRRRAAEEDGEEVM